MFHVKHINPRYSDILPWNIINMEPWNILLPKVPQNKGKLYLVVYTNFGLATSRAIRNKSGGWELAHKPTPFGCESFGDSRDRDVAKRNRGGMARSIWLQESKSYENLSSRVQKCVLLQLYPRRAGTCLLVRAGTRKCPTHWHWAFPRSRAVAL